MLKYSYAEPTPKDLMICHVSSYTTDPFRINVFLASAAISYCYVIAVTAHALTGDRARLLQSGFDGYASKPFQLKELGEELQRFKESRYQT